MSKGKFKFKEAHFWILYWLFIYVFLMAHSCN